MLAKEIRNTIIWDKEPEELTNEELFAERDVIYKALDMFQLEVPGLTNAELCFLEHRFTDVDCELYNRNLD
jgi:hypothetical protein